MALSVARLRVLVAVARERSIPDAARALGVAQPAVSRAVRELEHEAGAPLFERAHGGVRPTEAGIVLLAHGRQILAELQAAEEDLVAVRGLTRGTLRIAASPTVAAYYIPPLLRAFSRRHPAVELRLASAPTRLVVSRLLDRDADVALVETGVDDERLVVEPWGHDELVVVVGRDHPLAGPRAAGKPRLTTSALTHELLILREPGAGTREVVLSALAARGVVPTRTLDADSMDAIREIAATGLGIAILSRAAVLEPLSVGRLVILDIADLRIRRPLYRLAAPATTQSPAARAFLALLGDTPVPGAELEPPVQPVSVVRRRAGLLRVPRGQDGKAGARS